jgi:AraC-like DNA-binding protein
VKVKNKQLKVRWLYYFFRLGCIGLILCLPAGYALNNDYIATVINMVFIFVVILGIFIRSVCFTGFSMQMFPELFAIYKQKPEMNPDRILLISEALTTIMETTRIYLSPDSTLEQVAKGINIPRHQLSYFINTTTDGSFSDFINRYRIRDACVLLLDIEKHLKLEAIASECGFGSRMSFFRAFIKVMGITPTEYQSDPSKFLIKA